MYMFLSRVPRVYKYVTPSHAITPVYTCNTDNGPLCCPGLTIDGDIRVNGEKLGRGITAISSFVQQDDLFVGILKVKEHLWFQVRESGVRSSI